MKIYLLGVNHYDPLCRSVLRISLANLHDAEPNPPKFVAVEWAEPIFARVVTQREHLRELAAQYWIHAPDEVLDQIGLSLAFEADTHEAVFPSVPTLWLDAGREEEISEDLIVNYSLDRCKIYKDYARQSVLADETDALLTALSREAWARSSSRPDGRDQKWLSRILARSTQEGWAIAIIGAYHTGEDDYSLHKLLLNNGFDVVIVDLRPF